MSIDLPGPAAGSSRETRRLAALHALDLLDSAPEREFDALVALAAEMLSCPAAMITLVDHDRQWVKAGVGNDFSETPRSVAFCDHTIRQSGTMIVPDAAADQRFAANPLVTGAEHIRFYAGAPIRAKDDGGTLQPIGAICVCDTVPRSLSPQGEAALGHFAALAEALIAARATTIAALSLVKESERQADALARQQRIFAQAERLAMVGSWRLGLADQDVTWSDHVFRIHGLPVGAYPSLTAALDFYPPEAQALIAERMATTIATGEPYDIEADLITAAGDRRRVRSMAELERDADGNPHALIGVFQDVTDAHRQAEQLRRAADTDFLTGIANRAGFQRHLDAARARAGQDGTPLAVALIDLDGFKRINDSFGHHVGDDALRAVAGRLGAAWLAGCTPGRIGGDEFALIVENPALLADPAGLVARLDESLRVTLNVQGMAVLCGGSVGLAFHQSGDEPTRDFMRRADDALYAAKRDRVGRRTAA